MRTLRRYIPVAACLAVLAARPAIAQNQCVFYLANHLSTGPGPLFAQTGVGLSLEAPADSGTCALSAVTLQLTVGDGRVFHTVSVNHAWQTGVVYSVQAVVTGAGPQQLWLNGQSAGTLQGDFQPAAAQLPLTGSEISDSGTCSTGSGACETYLVTQISLQATNGASSVDIAPNGANPAPPQMMLMSWTPSPPQGAPWQEAFPVNAAQTTTITASFRFDPFVQTQQFDPAIDPTIDAYGQTICTGCPSWPGKVQTPGDFQTVIQAEEAWFANNAPLTDYGLDPYGGSKVAGWTDIATHYFHTAYYNHRWWLISPDGNPLFYIGLDGLPNTSSGGPAPGATFTPLGPASPSNAHPGRLPMFPSLPSDTGLYTSAYATNQNGETGAQAINYFSFAVSNWIQKYSSDWQNAESKAISRRLPAWAFAGSGKWSNPALLNSQFLSGTIMNPVLDHNSTPNVVTGGHPDVFDPSIVEQLYADLASQIEPYRDSPWILGWSVGNESDQIVASGEVTSILQLHATTPAKKALVDYAYYLIYRGSVSMLASHWGITATTLDQVYASQPQPENVPGTDVERMRQFYEATYYGELYATVKIIDHNHLYLGSWIQPKVQVNKTPLAPDWPIAAANCDVIGIDYYNPEFSEPDIEALIASTNKPVLIGEFSFPSNYGGMRGFGSKVSAGDYALTDSQSGDFYARWLSEASANPYVVGLEWFDYLDQAVTGRGNKNGRGNDDFSLVLDDNYAFGMMDVTDTPKFDLVNKVRAANIGTLQSLGLLGKTPVLSITLAHAGNFTAGQSNATYMIAVANGRDGQATAGTITVKETLPSGLTLVSMTGSGWTCNAGTCTRADSLPGGSGYPPITVTVNVVGSATSLVNQVSVSGGGSPGEISSDPTTITGQ